MDASPRIALYPGSFDPLTVGHVDVVRRSLRLADRVVVAVSYAPTHSKQELFAVGERVEMIRQTFAGEPRVETVEFQGLLVELARRVGARMVVRGVRTVADFEYEVQMASMNRRLAPEVETVLLPPDPEHGFVSATLVRQVAALGGDASPFVPVPVLRALRARFPLVR